MLVGLLVALGIVVLVVLALGVAWPLRPTNKWPGPSRRGLAGEAAPHQISLARGSANVDTVG